MKRILRFAYLLILTFYSGTVQAQTLISTIAGTGTVPGFAGDGGQATGAKMNNPSGVFVDAAGVKYIADYANHVIRKIDATGVIKTIAGTPGSPGYGGDGGPATGALLKNPAGIYVDGSGNIYFTEYNNHIVRKINTSGNISTFAGNGGSSGFGGDGSLATSTATKLSFPVGITGDASGNIFVADANNHRIRKIAAVSNIITTIAGKSGGPGFSGDNGPATNALLSNPFDVAVDAAGNFYISDQTNYCIRKINTTGTITTIAGTATSSGFSGDGGPATSAKFNAPCDIWVNSAGTTLLIADRFNNCVRQISSGVITTIAGQGTVPGYSGDGGPATSATLHETPFLYPDASGNLYISDFGNHVIRMVAPCSPPLVDVITGPTRLCTGATDTLKNDSTGGTWTASNGSLVIDPVTGIITGISAGIDTISYAITNACGTTTVTFIDTVAAAPSAISGTLFVCVGSSTILTSLPSGGVWSSSNTSVATVATGTVSGVAQGTTTITYAMNRCPVFATVTVNPAPAAIQPPGSVVICTGKAFALSDATSGGTWSSTNTSVATIGTGGGVTGVTTGTATISYTNSFSCAATKNVTVVTSPAAISPSTATICSGHGVAMSDATSGGTWSSSNTSIATVGTSGAVTGVSGGSATITYTLGTCFSTATVTVNPSPADITPSGAVSVCVGNTATLSSSAGGTWSSANTLVATIGTSGVVTGMATGSSTISYSTSFGCFKTKTVTVISGVGAISPSAPVVCAGSTLTLSDATGGGVWSSTATSVATIGTGGVVTGVAAGTTTISYTVGSCFAITTLTVNPSPSAINPPGPVTLCVGNTFTLSDATGGATWSSSNTSFATVSSGGLVTAVGTGVVVISYTNSSACSALKTVTVTVAVGTISPSSPTVCAGSTIALSDATSGGVWSSTATSVATVGTSGIVTGVAAGTSTISYTIGSCNTTTTLTVNLAPAAITGFSSVCEGLTDAFSDATGGGTWTSSNTAVINISPTLGSYAANNAGTATVTYTVSGGCFVTKSVTVNPLVPLPAPFAMCQGTSTTLTGVSGSTWTSSNTSVATVNSSGVLTAVSAGTSSIMYTTSAGCASVTTVSVNALPAAISGPTGVCTGSSISLSDATGGGTWASSNTAVATITSGGSVSGVSTGTTVISYTGASGCLVTTTVTVSATPAAISPSSTSICPGSTIGMSDATGGGTWSSGNTSVATVSSGGLVTGVATGGVNISYSTGGCFVTAPVLVNPTPSAIGPAGSVSVCIGGTTTLSDATPAGTWSSSNTSVATINSGGLVTGMGVGSVNISYTNTFGCSVTKPVTVNTTPSAIVPSSPQVCVGSTIGLSDAVTGGAWASNNTAIATISSGGVATGVAGGTTTITYSIGTCTTGTTLLVNPLPSAITPAGAVTVCVGTTASLSSTTGGGVWSSGNTSVATVNSSGVVTGASAGNVNIFYTSVSGCTVSKSVTVNVTPVAISPIATTVCPGSTVALSDAVSGGSWASSNTSLATVGSTGIVTGVAQGSLTITYAIGSCQTTSTVTVNPAPNAGTITGAGAMCVGSSLTVSDAVAGGVWSSSNTSVATVNSSGLVSGLSGGTVTITYAVTNVCGTARALATVSVNTAPTSGTILGPSSICAGTTLTLSNATTGGSYTASSTHLSVTSGGLLTGISVGTGTVTYTVTTPCGTASTTKTITVGAFLTAGTISGGTVICAGSSLALSDPAAGGVWSSSNTSVAVVGTSGVVTGVGAGVDTISYTVTASCGSAIATHTLTVNPLPNAGSIIGTSLLCAGLTFTYSDAAPGGVWSTTNPKATITGTGLLTGITPGTDTILYSVTNSCGTAVASKVLTIGTYLSSGTISGPASVCVASSITLSDAVPGGIWSSSNTSVATVGTSGIVTGMSAALDTISYTVTSSCGSATSTYTVLVNPLPNPGSISGPSAVCLGAPVTLSNSVSGGAWSSSSTANATVSGTGVVTAVSPGVATISYTVSNMCGTASATKLVNVGSTLTAGSVSGPSSVCEGSSITLSDAATGGIWSSTNTSVAVVGSTGIVTGISGGTASIVYTFSNVCGSVAASQGVTVNPLPDPGVISGPASVCIGSSITLSNSVSGGTWSTGNTNATITSGGVVTPVAIGSVTVSYSVTNGCGTLAATKVISIGTTPAVGSISGPSGICLGSSVTLSDAIPGGIWASSNTAVATVGTSGITTGVGLGTATITYIAGNACGVAMATTTVAISNPPNAGSILGPSGLCAGTFTVYLDFSPGGVWSVTNTNATITGAGVLNAVTPFSVDTVLYTVTNGCGTAIASKVVNIGMFFTPGTITGPTVVCTGTSIALSDAVPGGIWSSSNTALATIGTTGVVTGIASGTATISYSVTASCGTATATQTITINNSPNAGVISGPSSVCVGSLIALTDAVAGGAWGASNGNATVSITGVVTGVFAGLDTISYSVTNSCGTIAATRVITVNSLPATGTITGASAVCAGASVALTNAVSGGIWSSSNTSVAVVGTSGIVTGANSGNVTISYTLTNMCGSASTTKTITVNPLPVTGTISGPDTVCVGSSITLTDAITGGVWSAGNSNATVSGGIVTGVSAGNVPISYSVTNGCGTLSAVKVINVNTAPYPGVISGPSAVCVGTGIALTDPVAGGIWVVSNSNAIVAGPGIIDGVLVGVDTVFYSVTNACGTNVANKIITINPVPVPAPITGISGECAGTTITLSNTIAGGIWTSSNTAVASIGLSSGILNALTAGTTTITYTITNVYGCPASSTFADTVITVPGLSAITGSLSVCEGAATLLSHADPGGTWTSSNTSIAVIDPSTGLLTGVAAGTTVISYSVMNICGSATTTRVETINALPSVAAISGSANVCTGSGLFLSDATPGGVWSSSNTAIASIGTSGFVIGLSPGTTTIIYAYTNITGCTGYASMTETVHALPVISSVTGITHECIGATTILSSATPGGNWTSANTSVAVAGAISGAVTGISTGTATIIYTVTDVVGCTSSVSVTDTVNGTSSISPITGPSVVCVGSSITLSDATPGGAWSATNSSATVAGGVVSGMMNGVDTIMYTVTDACGISVASMPVNILSAPVAGTITGATGVCTGATITMSSSVAGGLWSTSDLSVSVGSTSGNVTGIAAGSASISYTVTNVCGSATTTTAISILTLPDPGIITGSSSVCLGGTLMLTDATGGGTWSATNGSATVAGGLVTGIATGTDTIMYSVSNVCGTSVASRSINIVTVPGTGTITGPSVVCMGSFINLSDATPGGVWSSSNPLVASVNPAGLVTPKSPGMANIQYNQTNACGTAFAIHPVTVLSLADCNGGTLAAETESLTISELRVYPNPTSGVFTMNLISGITEDVHVTVTDVVGRKITELNTNTNRETQIKLDQPGGIYILYAVAGDRTYIQKITVK